MDRATPQKLYFIWSEKFETGNKLIDTQHQQLFTLGNELFSSDYSSGKKYVMEFYKYTRTHFEAEEKLMREIDYPGYSDHRKIHEELLEGLNKVSENYFDDEGLFEQFKIFVYKWLTQHIMYEDKKIAT